jgi:ornithine carbamoyltransferase
MRHLTSIDCLTTNQLEYILKLCNKAETKPHQFDNFLKNKTIGAFFQRPSTRMRFALEAAVNQMGGSTVFFKTSDTHMSRGESVADTIRVLSSYLDAIVVRARSQQDIEDLTDFGSIPVLNAMTTLYYPVMAICSFYTLQKHFKSLKGLKIAYVGDGNNICHSLMLGASLLGINMSVITPHMYEPAPFVMEIAKENATKSNTVIELSHSLDKVEDADILYTDVWISMGMEEEREERVKAFKNYQINNSLIKKTKKTPVILHPMPVRRGEEIVSNLVNRSMIFENASNMLYVTKAILYYLF